VIDKCTDRDARPYVTFSPTSILVFIFLTFLSDNNVCVSLSYPRTRFVSTYRWIRAGVRVKQIYLARYNRAICDDISRNMSLLFHVALFHLTTSYTHAIPEDRMCRRLAEDHSRLLSCGDESPPKLSGRQRSSSYYSPIAWTNSIPRRSFQLGEEHSSLRI
jgi:hypothetical protein